MAGAMSDPTGVDIDNVAEDIQARADVADAEFKKTIDNVDTKIEKDVALARKRRRATGPHTVHSRYAMEPANVLFING